MIHARNFRSAAAALCAAVLLGGCAAPSAFGTAKASAPAYAVTITRESSLRHLPFLSRTVREKATVLALYRDMEDVKPVPKPFIYMCPADFGVSYRLTFDLGGKVLHAMADGSGCRFIQIGKNIRLWSAGPSGAAFWAELGKILSLSGQQLEAAPRR